MDWPRSPPHKCAAHSHRTTVPPDLGTAAPLHVSRRAARTPPQTGPVCTRQPPAAGSAPLCATLAIDSKNVPHRGAPHIRPRPRDTRGRRRTSLAIAVLGQTGGRGKRAARVCPVLRAGRDAQAGGTVAGGGGTRLRPPAAAVAAEAVCTGGGRSGQVTCLPAQLCTNGDAAVACSGLPAAGAAPAGRAGRRPPPPPPPRAGAVVAYRSSQQPSPSGCTLSLSVDRCATRAPG